MSDRTIYLLIGPKGSGKTHIGTVLNTHFGMHFVRVENWAKAVRRERAEDDTAKEQLKESCEGEHDGGCLKEQCTPSVDLVAT